MLGNRRFGAPVYEPPTAPLTPALVPAPGAGGAKACGILSIPAGIICFPVGIVLAIVALVQQAKARRFAREEPDAYEMPTSTGMVTAIIGLSLVPILMAIGMVSAIAIPALLSQRGRARDKAAIENMVGRTADLVGQWDKQREVNTPQDQIPAALEAWLKQNTAADKNPWDPTAPAFTYHIKVVSDLDEAAMGDMVASEAATLGQPVFIVELPAQGRAGYLAGAVRTQMLRDGNAVSTKVVEIE